MLIDMRRKIFGPILLINVMAFAGGCKQFDSLPLTIELCASPETFRAVQTAIFDDVRRDYQGRVKYVNDLDRSFTTSVENTTSSQIREDIKKVDCQGRLNMTVPAPLMETFDRESNLVDDIGYSVQVSADQQQYVYTVGGYDGVRGQLLAAARRLESADSGVERAVTSDRAASTSRAALRPESRSSVDLGSIPGPTNQDSNNVWSHNGSILRLYAKGNQRAFYYERPRAGLAAAPGDLLFDGQRNGDSFFGTARLFSSRCGVTAYDVAGRVGADRISVTMTGTAPIRNDACEIISYRTDVLRFDLVHQ